MNADGRPITLLIADDDPDDRMLIRDALLASRVANDLRFVSDGDELLRYLRRCDEYAQGESAPRPGLILLDLNMPGKDGREALAEIKADRELRRIPVVVLTTSQEETDILRSYDLGASSFIVKPVSFEALVGVMKVIGKYWFEIVEPPPSG